MLLLPEGSRSVLELESRSLGVHGSIWIMSKHGFGFERSPLIQSYPQKALRIGVWDRISLTVSCPTMKSGGWVGENSPCTVVSAHSKSGTSTVLQRSIF